MSGSLDDGHSNYFSNNLEKVYESGQQGPAAARRAKQQGSAGSATRAEARAATRPATRTKARTAAAGPAAQRKDRTEKLIWRRTPPSWRGSPSSRSSGTSPERGKGFCNGSTDHTRRGRPQARTDPRSRRRAASFSGRVTVGIEVAGPSLLYGQRTGSRESDPTSVKRGCGGMRGLNSSTKALSHPSAKSSAGRS